MLFGEIARSVGLFVVAGMLEIGGGYLVWLWLRQGRAVWLGALGGAILFLYGIVPTLQSDRDFGRIYAAYGGIFIVLSIIWGIALDGFRPDRYDLIGASLALLGVVVMMWGRSIF